MSAVPTLAEVQQYLGAYSGSAAVVRDAYAVEVADQANRCRVEPYDDALAGALRRRVACNLARKGVPLGVEVGEVGVTRISSNDPEVRRLEAPFRRMPIG